MKNFSKRESRVDAILKIIQNHQFKFPSVVTHNYLIFWHKLCNISILSIILYTNYCFIAPYLHLYDLFHLTSNQIEAEHAEWILLKSDSINTKDLSYRHKIKSICVCASLPLSHLDIMFLSQHNIKKYKNFTLEILFNMMALFFFIEINVFETWGLSYVCLYNMPICRKIFFAYFTLW